MTERPVAIAMHDRSPAGRCDRRQLLAGLAGGAIATLCPGIVAPAAAQATPENESGVEVNYVQAELDGGRVLQGFITRQKAGEERLPGVVLIHGEDGLTPHVRDVARRLALEGFVAFAPDMLSLSGGTPTDAEAARAAMAALDIRWAAHDAAQAVRWMARERRTTGAVAVMGFGWGGTVAERAVLAAGVALRAGVTYYGTSPRPAEVAWVQAPLLIQFAGLEQRANRGGEAWVRALQRAGRTVSAYFYPGVAAGFADDTAGTRYDPGAARLAWDRTIAFLQQHLA